MGDKAITLNLGDRIDEGLNQKAVAIREWLKERRYPGIEDILVSYSSVSIFYDPVEPGEQEDKHQGAVFAWMRERLLEAWEKAIPLPYSNGEPIRIPVYYGGQHGADLEIVARQHGLSTDEVIHIHSSGVYRVYMLGFLPGFCYLGKLDKRLEMPRKMAPVSVPAGSVGIVGEQTCVYPLLSPGGWQIIGRTPVRLFNPEGDPPVSLKIGDHVRFEPA